MHIRFTIAVVACSLLMPTPATGDECSPVALRFASGYPDAQYTNGTSQMFSFNADAWGVVGVFLELEVPTVITGFSGIGADPPIPDFDPDHFHPMVNVHSSAQAFADDGLHGDIIDQRTAALANVPQAFGQNAAGNVTYWIEATMEPFPLEPGTYVFTAYIEGGSDWRWSESSIDLGSDIFTWDGYQGLFVVLADSEKFPTGTMAVDIDGYPAGTCSGGPNDGNLCDPCGADPCSGGTCAGSGPVPTVSQWGLIIMSTLLVVAGAGVVSKRRSVSA